MVKIIPAILAKSKKEFEHKLEIIRSFAQEIQIDVMDGKFVSNTTWAGIKEIKKMDPPLFEVHLMVKDPENNILKWVEAGAKRIIAHFETLKDAPFFIKQVKTAGCQAGMAINLETTVSAIANLLDILDVVLVMGVNPGFSGQDLDPSNREKVAEIRKLNQNITIEVDGGVNLDNAADLVKAGANGLIAASAIFDADDPKTAYEKLLKIANASPSRQKS